MPADPYANDIRAIEALIARQFASVCWGPGRPADWGAFAADFFPDAALYPSARPVKRQTVEGFVERMKGLAGGSLRTFDERAAGAKVHVFGNVAVAMGVCEVRENGGAPKRGVEALLLVKDEGRWRIVAQAWDMEAEAKPIPAGLLGGGKGG
jgi:ketosteroid isomerase-like protein